MSQNPLVTKEIGWFMSLPEWRKAWEECHLLDILYGLLFTGLDLPISFDDKAEQICFYLELADGHKKSWNFKDRREKDGGSGHFYHRTSLGEFNYSYEIRQHLAKKAFQVLCAKLFKNNNKPHEFPSWVSYVSEPKVLEKILWFLRQDKSSPNTLVNITGINGNNHDQTAAQFALELCQLGLRDATRDEDIARGPIGSSRTRARLIGILDGLKRLDLLLDGKRYPLDIASTEALWQVVGDGKEYSPQQLDQETPFIGAIVLLSLQASARAKRATKREQKRKWKKERLEAELAKLK